MGFCSLDRILYFLHLIGVQVNLPEKKTLFREKMNLEHCVKQRMEEITKDSKQLGKEEHLQPLKTVIAKLFSLFHLILKSTTITPNFFRYLLIP